MLFNSYIFVFLFLPVTLFGYFFINKFSFFFGKFWLLVMSLWFYAYFNIKYLPIITVSILFNYTFNRMITASRSSVRRKIWLAAASAANIGVLFYFKYYDFFADNINALFNTDFTLHHLVLPLGISFFTFQQLSYVIDSYRGEVPDYNILDYALFVTFFPQLISGPIVTHDEIVPQFEDPSKKSINFEKMSTGIMAFSFGLAKKVLLADTFGNAVNWGFSNSSELSSAGALLVMLFYTFQIYFDFSGYCDMASGIGLMFNIDIAMNFNSPYRALTVSDFWDRWHITLKRFFMRYIYIPLGGSRRGKVRTYINILIVFLVSGLWHGANWTFIVWGVIHGIFSAADRLFRKQIQKLNSAVSWLLTFCFINISWIFFRADSLSQAVRIIRTIFSFKSGAVNREILKIFYLPEFSAAVTLFNLTVSPYSWIFMAVLSTFALYAVLFMQNTNERIDSFSPTPFAGFVSVMLIVFGIISFSGISTFLYFNF